MNRLIENGSVEEMSCGANFAYILRDSGTFLSTEYKVFQNQEDGCFLRCMKLLYNGKMQFYYLSAGYQSLEILLPTLDAEKFLNVVSGIISNVVRIKHNGFLSCRNVDLSYDKIFVDVNTYKVRLVYLPVSEGLFQDENAFENELRTGLIRAISTNIRLDSQATRQLAADLANGLLPLEVLIGHSLAGKTVEDFSRVQNEHLEKRAAKIQEESDHSSKCMRLILINAPEKLVLAINKDSYVIGKNPARVDGVVSFNRMISRVHCRVVRNGTQYSIEDLGSANGTYINSVRVAQNQTVPVRNGDTVRLANSDFRVEIG